MSFSLVWGIEAQNDQVADETPSQIMAQVDSQVLQNTEDAQVVLDGADAADKVAQGAGQLAQVKQYVEDQVQAGGMSEQTAQLAQIHVESICVAMRMPIHGSAIPSIENFGSGGSRLTSTRVAAEGIGDRISTAWEALKKFVANLLETARNTWSKLWNNTMILEKKLDSLDKKLSELKGDVGTDDIDVKGALKLLGQKTFKPEASVTAIGPVVTAISSMKKGVEIVQKAAEEAISGKGEKLSVDFMKETAALWGAGTEWKDNVSKSEMLPGSRIIKFTITGTNEEGAGLSISIEREELKDATEKMKPLDKAAIKSALASARSAFALLKQQKEDATSFKAAAKDIDKGITAVINASKKIPSGLKDAAKLEEEKTINGRIERIRALYVTAATHASKLSQLVPLMTGETVRGIMGVCAQSMSTYKEKAST